MPPGFDFNRPTPGASAARGGPAPSRRAAAKAAAAGPSTALSLLIAAPSVNENIGGGVPPDGDIATSQGFTVQVNDFAITMYNLNTGTLAKQVNFATFFGDGRLLFDPRIIYDPLWNRFVVLVDGCNPCSGSGVASFFDLAISQTSDPTGGYFIYSFGVGTNAGDFVDFPQVGMDLNSIIFTYNDFMLGGGFDARTFAFPKAYFYNGLIQNVPIFGGSGCTVAPPYVLDNGSPSYTLVACPNDHGVFLDPILNSGLSNVSVNHWQAKVQVGPYNIPPCAPRPGFGNCLETSLDSRFENRSAQIGNEIWNVNVVQNGTTATPGWYEFNTSTNAMLGSSIWKASPTSSDFHPSIVVSGVGGTSGLTGETFGTWMSVDVANNINLQLHAIGGTDGNAGTGAGIAVGPASAQPLTNQTFQGRNRTGAYSYISLYPGPGGVGSCAYDEFAILEGEVSLGTIWGTTIGVVKHC